MSLGIFLDGEERHTLHDEGQRVIRHTEIDFPGQAIDPDCQSPRHRMEGGLWVRIGGRNLQARKDG